MSDMDEGDTNYHYRVCKCGIQESIYAWGDGEQACPECLAVWPENLQRRSAYDGGPTIRQWVPHFGKLATKIEATVDQNHIEYLKQDIVKHALQHARLTYFGSYLEQGEANEYWVSLCPDERTTRLAWLEEKIFKVSKELLMEMSKT